MDPFVVADGEKHPDHVEAQYDDLHSQEARSKVTLKMHNQGTEQESKVFN